MPGKAENLLQIADMSDVERLARLYNYLRMGFMPNTLDQLMLADELTRKMPKSPLRAAKLIINASRLDMVQPKKSRLAWELLNTYTKNAESAARSHRLFDIMATELTGVIDVPEPNPDSKLINEFVPDTYGSTVARWLRYTDLTTMLGHYSSRQLGPVIDPYSEGYAEAVLSGSRVKDAMKVVTVGQVNSTIGEAITHEERSYAFWSKCIEQVSQIDIDRMEGLRNLVTTAGEWVLSNNVSKLQG